MDGKLGATQFLSDLHQEFAKHVLSRAVAAVAPIEVAGGMFDEFLGVGGEELAPKIGVLCKFGAKCTEHDFVAMGVPIGSGGGARFPGDALAFSRGFGLLDAALALGIVGELHGLEVVFCGGPHLFLKFNRVAAKVGEISVGFVLVVEKNSHGAVEDGSVLGEEEGEKVGNMGSIRKKAIAL